MNDVLVIVDMQEGFRGPDALSVVPRVNRLAAAFNTVIHCEFYSEPGDRYARRLNWTLFEKAGQQEPLPELKLPRNHTTIRHNTYDISAELLAAAPAKPRRWFLCGVYTNICIQLTALKLFDADEDVFIVENACASLHGQAQHELAIHLLSRSIEKANIISTQSAINLTEGNAE